MADHRLPDEIVTYRPFLECVIGIFSDRELKLLLGQADRQTLKVVSHARALPNLPISVRTGIRRSG